MTRARASLIGLIATVLAMAGVTYVAVEKAEAHDFSATGVGDCDGNVVWTYWQKNTPAGMQTDVKAISYDDGSGPVWINAWAEHNQGGTIPSKTGNYTTVFTQTGVTKPVARVFIQVDYRNGPNSSDVWYETVMPTDCETEEPSPSPTPTPSDDPTPTEMPTPTDEPTPTSTPTTEPPVTDTPTTAPPTIDTPTVPPTIEPPVVEPPVEDRCERSPWACDKPKPGPKPHPGPPASYMVCEGGAWVVYEGKREVMTSGTCGDEGKRVPFKQVEEEGL